MEALNPSMEQLRDLLIGSKTLPVLFIGSGFSRRYINSPDWEGLLAHLAGLTGRPLSYFEGQVGKQPDETRLPMVASKIADAFYEIWWSDEKYAKSREQFADSIVTPSDPLKIEAASYIDSLGLTQVEALLPELEKLANVRIHAAITTNYDSVLEDSLPDMELYVGQESVLFAATQAVGEIYKIHGSASDPLSIVVTAEDYQEYWEKNPYLIAKMLTLFVEHPVIFIGYSLRDPHVQKLLGNLVSCLTEKQLRTLNDRIIFVGRPSSTRLAGLSRSSVTVDQHTFGVQEIGLEDFSELYELLANLPQHFPIKLLRQLSESVYQLAYSSEPAGRIYVLPFDAETQSDQVEVVVGVGTMERLGERGYSAFSRADLFCDMLSGTTDHNTNSLFTKLLPNVFRSAKFAPIWYPLHLAAIENTEVAPEMLPLRARQLLDGTTPLAPYPGQRPAGWRNLKFSELESRYPELAVNLGLGCVYDSIEDVLALKKYLDFHFRNVKTIPTPLAKLACKYDQLVFGDQFEGDLEQLRKILEIPA